MTKKIYVIYEHFHGETQTMNPVYESETDALEAVNKYKQRALSFTDVKYEVDQFDLMETNDY
jgi:hypothetical protein